MAVAGWSVDGKRVELRAGFPAGKLSVDGAEGVKLKAKGEFPVVVGGRTLTLKRVQGFLGPKNELVAPNGEVIPPSAKHVAPVPAPAGSSCGAHPSEAASIACARCGTFVCPACLGADGTHCRPCLALLLTSAQKAAAAMAFMAPVVVFGIAGGLLGALFALPAGAAAVAIAKRTEKKALKLAAAVGLYTLAAILYLVVVVAVQAGRKG